MTYLIPVTAKKTLPAGIFQIFPQTGIISVYVVEDNRFSGETQLILYQHLKELIKCSGSSRYRNKRIAHFDHQLLAVDLIPGQIEFIEIIIQDSVNIEKPW